MRKIMILAPILAALAGCTEMTGYYPEAEVTQIAGREFFVAPRPAQGAGVYLAGPNQPGIDEVLTGIDMTLPAANVAAIEAVTGCTVDPVTVRNTEATTYAAVTC